MRVRLTETNKQARRRSGTLRRPRPRPDAPPETGESAPADELGAERRMREAGGPDDRAMYSCSCGYLFDANVSTSVSCPHCGTLQAW